MMNPKLLLAALLILAPALAVHGCLVFQATVSTSGCDTGTLYSGITDNGYSMCTIASLPSAADNLYHFACQFKAYKAVFDPSTGVLVYTTDHGTFTIIASKPWGVDFVWSACAFCVPGPGECYAKTGVETCAPVPSPTFG